MKKIIMILCAVSFIAGPFVILAAYQHYNQQRIYQAMNEWQNKVTNAHLNGKSPEEVSAFLDAQQVAHDPYSGRQAMIGGGKMGYIVAHPDTAYYLPSVTGRNSWSVEVDFTFDEKNKCCNFFVGASGK